MVNEAFTNPFITCTFVGDEKLFVNLFYNHKDKAHYHFIWNIKTRKIIGKKNMEKTDQPVIHPFDCSMKNFPYKCFFDIDKGRIHSFYR